MKRYILFLSAIGIIATVFFINRIETKNQRQINKKFEYLFNNGHFAKGEVLYFLNNKSGNIYDRVSIKYSFYSESGVKYESSIGTLLPDFFDEEQNRHWKTNFNKAEKDEFYLVLYDVSNPEESILLLDRPIIKDLDLDNYIKEFKE